MSQAARVQIASLGDAGTITDGYGNAITSATVVVTNAAGQTVTPYASETGTATVSPNPDASGTISGWLDPGDYTLTVTYTPANGSTQVLTRKVAAVLSRVIPGPAPSGDTTGAADLASLRAVLATATAGSTVQLVRSPTAYVVKTSGTKTFTSIGSTAYAYALEIPTGVILDLNGATIKWASGQDGVMISNATGAANVGLIGYGTVDGNNCANTASGPIWFDTLAGLLLDVKIINADRSAIVLFAVSKITGPSGGARIVCDGVTGAGVAIGGGTVGRLVSDSHFALLEGRNVTPWPSNTTNFPGNPVAITAKSTTIDTIRALSSSAGVKIAQPSQDLVIGKVYCDTLGDSVGNSGFKLQGDGSGLPLRVKVGEVISTTQQAHGLYLFDCVDCTVTSYTGIGNQVLATGADVHLEGTRCVVGVLKSATSGGDAIYQRTLNTGGRLGIVQVYNPTGNALRADGGDLTIQSLTATDDRGGAAVMPRGIWTTNAAALVEVGRYEVTGAVTASVAITGSNVFTREAQTGPPAVGSVALSARSFANAPTIQVFTSSGTWTRPTGVTTVQAALLAGGAGGGSGRRSASGTVAGGGGGGGGGGFAQSTYRASDLTSTVAVTVGAAGTGGAAVTSNSTDGNAGTNGGASSFAAFLRAQPGTAGSGGTTSSGTGGGGGTAAISGGTGGDANSIGGNGAAGNNGLMGAPGGGAGGGVTTVPAAGNGGLGGSSLPIGFSTGGAAGTAPGGVGGDGGAATANLALPGYGGGGGAGHAAGAGGAGGAGGSYGGGGGGGGGALNGNSTGKGGDGAPGIVVVASW